MCTRVSLLLILLVTLQPLAISQQAPTLRLLGSVNAGCINCSAIGVSAYKNLVFTAAPVAGAGVAIVDMSDPAAPVFLGQTPIDPADAYGFEEYRALRIGHRDVLVLYLGSAYDAADHTVLRLFDIGNPADPRPIGTFETKRGGWHFEIARQGPRTLALLSAWQAEAFTSVYGSQPGLGDLLIVDISDPTRPVMVGEWGVIDEPQLGPEVFLSASRGTVTKDFAEGVWVSPNGARAYLAYADLGVIILDITDPSQPKYLGRVGYGADEQGDAFEARTVKDGSVLVRSSLTRWPFRTEVSSSAFDGVRSGGEDGGTPAIYALNGSHRLNGGVVPIGRGCPGDTYLADPAGAIALIEDGGPCGRPLKAGLAQDAQATGVIFYNPVYTGGFADSHGAPGTGARFRYPGSDIWVPITIPLVNVGWSTGSCLGQVKEGEGKLVATDCRETPHVEVDLTSVFVGYGRLDIFDIREPSAPVKLGTYGSPHSMDVQYALAHRDQPGIVTRDTSANHLETSGNIVYVSTWADGLRVVDLSQPSAPREIASWTGQGADPGDFPLCAWDILRHRDLVLLNGYKHGLYILEDVR
jgi:hypothetical protein